MKNETTAKPLSEAALLARAKELHETIRTWRRQIHRYPELGFSEIRTASLIKAALFDLDMPEIRLQLDAHGTVTGWEKEEHHWVHQLVEDLMLDARKVLTFKCSGKLQY